MKDLRAIKGKYLLHQLIAEGEHETQDFKYAISDARKIARSISAFANNRGGRLLIGVKDNGVIAGVKNEEDIYVIEQAASMYCRPAQKLRFTAIKAEDGLVVIRADIDPCTARGVQAREPDGRWRAYYRVADENIMATPLMVKAWRHKSSGTPALITIGRSENLLLKLIADSQSVTFDEYVRHSHLSIEAATSAVVNLYSTDMIGFVYEAREFRIALCGE